MHTLLDSPFFTVFKVHRIGLKMHRAAALLCDAWQQFYLHYPALLYACALLLGVAWAKHPTPILILPSIALALPLLHTSRQKQALIRLLLATVTMLAAFLWVNVYYKKTALGDQELKGTAHLDISSLALVSTPFGSNWNYRGTIRTFVHQDENSESHKLHNLPYWMSISQNKKLSRPPANVSYLVEGRLKESQPGKYIFIPSKEAPWRPIRASWSAAEVRYHLKSGIKRYLATHIPDARSAAFLTGLSTGDFDDRQMQFEFSRFGLQHIMAISGFHFAILAAIISQFLALIFSKKWSTCLLIFLMSSYFLFLGNSPSILRAWVMILLVLAGFLLERRTTGLNALGIALMVVLLLDPLAVLNMGFQFSFATTAAILLFYGPIELFLQRIFTKRALSEVIEMDRVDKHGYLAITFIRQALALAGAVNLVALPMTLFFFNKFPLFALLYNLFFPFLVSISMLLLLIAAALGLVIPSLGLAIHAFNSSYTSYVLNFAYELPINWDRNLRVSEISFEEIVGYLTLLFCAGIVTQYALKQRQETLKDFQFL